jgi:hypothetical protein
MILPEYERVIGRKQMKARNTLRILLGTSALLMVSMFTQVALANGNQDLRLICPEPGSGDEPYYQRLEDGKEFSADGPKDLARLLKICYNMLVIEALSSPGCGNGLIEGDETCDGSDLAGESCASQGWIGGGDLACGSTCQFDVSGCLPSCDDGIQNGLETGLDCGGPICDACPPPAPSCTDGVLNGDESDIDCGGRDCGYCSVGEMCRTASDCGHDYFCDTDGTCQVDCTAQPNDPQC